jgi:predicted ABC-type ATPase
VTPDLPSLLREAAAARQPLLIALVGSNGAGKSTFYRTFVEPSGLEFLNADVVAKELNPTHPEAASYDAMHIVERERRQRVADRRSFCFETVLSDPEGEKVAFLKHARTLGYQVVVAFIRIPSADYSTLRVSQRVREGGHNVPQDKLRDRFARTQANVAKALAIADIGLVYDNSSAERPFQLVEVWRDGRRIGP